ncbi:MAG: hypothetical protein QXK37_04430 [Candidatus Woesearchaeota archaeon]
MRKKIEDDLKEALLKKFLSANFYYLIAIVSFTLSIMFCVQGFFFHKELFIGYALTSYLFGVILFLTAIVCLYRGAENYRYH